MNIFLIPYTWMRHFAVAMICAAAGLLAWWVVLFIVVVLQPFWNIHWDGAVYLGLTAAFTAGASLLAEGSLRRMGLAWRVGRTIAGAAITGAQAMLFYWIWDVWAGPLILGTILPEAGEDLADASLVSLRYRLGAFLLVGFATANGPAAMRRLSGYFSHVGAGLLAGMAAALVWYAAALPKFLLTFSDLYLAAALGSMTFGAVYGVFAWGIPENLYAGWIRVVTESRFGRRIPISAPDDTPRERFIGHYPRGLDLFLPAEDKVMELHISVSVDQNHQYRLRGLTLEPTLVKRLLERLDLSYDSRRPAPLQARLQSGDRIHLGPKNNPTILEFIMLPREER